MQYFDYLSEKIQKHFSSSERQYGRRMLRGRKVMNFVGRDIKQCLQEERCFLAAAMARLHKLYSWETTQIAVIHQLLVVSQTGRFPQDPTDQPRSVAWLQR